MDDIPNALTEMHAAGVMRAVASTLDCAAVVVAVVSATPTSIIDLTLGRLRRGLRDRVLSQRVTEAKDFEKAAHDLLETALTSSGPPGWLDWALDLRNMYVHRGRRLSMDEVNLSASLVDARGRPVPRVSVTQRLPSSPSRSDMEVFRDYRAMQPLLPEAASSTLHGIVATAVRFVDAIAHGLHETWQRRRARPSVEQPPQQWPERTFEDDIFTGYEPGSAQFDPRAFQGSPVFVKRMMAAAMFDGVRDRVWK